MTRTILVPVDMSAKAGLAVAYATHIARAADAQLTLYAVISDEALRYSANHQLRRAAEPAELAGVSVETRVERRDEVAAAVVEQARTMEADLVVMATAAWSDLDRWLRGSVADEVLRQADVPVLIVPPRGGQPVVETTQGIGVQRRQTLTLEPFWPAPGEPVRILVALDGSDFSAQALAPARTLAGTLKAELVLLYVVHQPAWRPPAGDDAATPDWARDELSAAQHYLDTVAATLSSGAGPASTLAVVGDPPAAIAEAARTCGAHLIAMATRGRGGIARQVLGSVATATLQQATIPILLVRPTEAGR